MYIILVLIIINKISFYTEILWHLYRNYFVINDYQLFNVLNMIMSYVSSKFIFQIKLLKEYNYYNL